MNTKSALAGLLALIALLLAANLTALLAAPRQKPQPNFLPAAHAGQFVDTNRPYLITTSNGGDVLYIWHLGDIVGDRFENVDVQVFPAARR